MRFITRLIALIFLALFSLGLLGLVGATGLVIFAISYYSQDLPDYSQLKEYQPPVITRLYAGDGRLMAEYAEEKRVFVPVDVMPDLLKKAFIAAEDQNFYRHQGVDYMAIIRAGVTNLRYAGSSKRPIGASTITQQVAKNFLLTNEVSLRRKIREAILAFRMEKALSKDRLLELYLNEIFLGRRAYGVAAAGLAYFNKSLDELSLAEMAYLAALPKGPNNYNPLTKPEAARERRDWVLDRMAADSYITRAQAESAKTGPVQTFEPDPTKIVTARFFAEEVRRELIARYGEKSLYNEGLAVRTTIDPRLQGIAEMALRNGLMAYDRRWGWRGPLASFPTTTDWKDNLLSVAAPKAMPPGWRLAFVLDAARDHAALGFADGTRGTIPLEHVKWAKRRLKEGGFSAEPASTADVLARGDVVMVEAVTTEEPAAEGKPAAKKTSYALRQVPRVNGALVAMDPHTGRVLALQGGWNYEQSEFNRATQALRQPGSAFKPFVYLTALEKGFTPSTLILDAPFVIDQGPGMPKWRPSNYKGEYYGPTTLRVGVEKSRNLMTVRLAHAVGMDAVVKTAHDFGITEMEPHLANSLGAGETTVLRMATAYAMLVNGGKKVTPTLVDRIQDRRGKTIYRHDSRACGECGTLLEWNSQQAPLPADNRPQVVDARYAYQMVSILEGVVQRGTAVKIKDLGFPVAGKTGTTNESRDVWFMGFTPDLVVGVFVGFDEPESLGKRETGSSVSLPVFRDFMVEAMKDIPPVPFRIPPGIRQIQINAHTGQRARAEDDEAVLIWEAFLTGTDPGDSPNLLDDSVSLQAGDVPDMASDGAVETYPAGGVGLRPQSQGSESSATMGTGGLY